MVETCEKAAPKARTARFCHVFEADWLFGLLVAASRESAAVWI